jgi:mannosylglycerate hydrolase
MRIKKIIVVSNTHWDREFRQSFEKTRYHLLEMMDRTLDILQKDPTFHSFTLDGHTILINDYLEMRPEKLDLVKEFIQNGRLKAGPWYTLVEQFSVSHEPLVRNLLWGQKLVRKYGGKQPTVAYTPSSWGQTGQLPQILKEFGLKRIMFYRGISHHESDAEFIWAAPDGSEVLASRFAIYARYNWYYQVYRPATRNNRVFEKDYRWGEFDEIPVKNAINDSGDLNSFTVLTPDVAVNLSVMKNSIVEMLEKEGKHFTTPVFLAMHGHDISSPHPGDSKMVAEAGKVFDSQITVTHGDLEMFWDSVEKHIKTERLARLFGERRSYLKTGMWTYLFPGTISARTYLKQQDFLTSNKLVYEAEPLATLSFLMGGVYPEKYLTRAWNYLLRNHTHDANGGCAPDAVCLDMEYRYRKVRDISNIVRNDSTAYIAKNLSSEGLHPNALQLIVFNPLPFTRQAILKLDLDIPEELTEGYISFLSPQGNELEVQPLSEEGSSVFVDSALDVPCIIKTRRIALTVNFTDLPAMGYRSYRVVAGKMIDAITDNLLVRGENTLENEFLRMTVNSNGTIDVSDKSTGKTYSGLNYLSDQGEGGNAWQHEDLLNDSNIDSRNLKANIKVLESGPLTASIRAEYTIAVPVDYGDGKTRNSQKVELPVSTIYRLQKGKKYIQVHLTINNLAKDHWLRAKFPTRLKSSYTWADSHFDVVDRPVKLPDSTGWVEPARGTHPMRTFVEMHDGSGCFALFSKGLFEYEAFDDGEKTLALTLIRACRIKLAVSEEKKTELPDEGIQSPGLHSFEYAVYIGNSSWQEEQLHNIAAEYFQPPTCLLAGRGKGSLPSEISMFSLDNKRIHITAIKRAENSNGLIVRLYNPSEFTEFFTLKFHNPFKKAFLGSMAENIEECLAENQDNIRYSAGAKKIVTLLIEPNI